MGALLRDLRFAVRMLVKTPGPTLVALFTLPLGIGATTAIFSVIHGVLLKPLPYAEPERLIALRSNTSAMNLEDLLAWSRTIAAGNTIG